MSPIGFGSIQKKGNEKGAYCCTRFSRLQLVMPSRG